MFVFVYHKMAEKIWKLSELEEVRNKVEAECYKRPGNNCELNEAEMYDHDGGNFAEGKKEKQWIYFTCKICEYQWALWKLLNKIDNKK